MPQRKDSGGWKLPPSLSLREGQAAVLDLITDPTSAPRRNNQLIAELPTGYGKTLVICAVYALLREQGLVGRLLIVVPSDEQFTSYLAEIEEDMGGILNAPITGALDAASLLALKEHRKNTAEVFVTTVQTLSRNFGVVAALLETGRWMVAADEFHRYARDNTWGKAVAQLNSVFTLAVSATPDRTDRAEKAIAGVPDVSISLREAVEEGAIRPVVVRSSEYALDITLKDDPTPRRLRTSELGDELSVSGSDISIQEVKLELRYYDKYLHKTLLDAWGKLLELNQFSPGQHKMIVFALGVGHAKKICEQLNSLAGESIADWIGVQSTVTKDDGTTTVIGRSEKDNRKILDKFKAGEFDVLVQVRKATEGFNDVKCSVLLFLNLVGETVKLKQMNGRGLRRNYEVEPHTGKRASVDRCWIYVSNDHPGLEYMKRLESDVADLKDDDDGPGGGGDNVDTGPLIYGIREFFILDANYNGEELYYPFGGEQIAQSTAVAKARANVPELAAESDEVIQQHLRKLFNMEPKQASTTERLERARKKTTEAARQLAMNVVRVRADRCGGTFPKSLLGDTNRVIHSRWKRLNPSLSHDTMTVDEFELKYNWVREINNAMKDASDPFRYLQEGAPWLIL